MSFLLTCTAKDLRRRLADPMALVLWLAIPLLVGGLMSLIFGGQDAAPPKATVLLVDEDASVVGTALSALAQNSDMLDMRAVTRAEGDALMLEGKASAMVVLPAGFGSAVLNSQPTSITLVRNPAQVILPGIVQTGLEMLIEIVGYVQRLFAEPLRQILGATPGPGGFLPSQAVALFSGEVNDRLQRLGPWLAPPVMAVEFVDTRPAPTTAAATVNIGALFLPSMIFMAVLFIAQGMADDLWDEKDAGTLRRAVALPHSLTIFMASKLAAAGVVMAAVGAAGLGVLLAAGAVTLARAPMALAWLTFAGTAVFCFFLVLQFVATTRRGASVLANVVLFPLMMIGGAFFPLETMPAWMQAAGAWTPNGQALIQFKHLIAGQATLTAVGVAVVAIGVPAAAAFGLSARLLGGRFATRA